MPRHLRTSLFCGLLAAFLSACGGPPPKTGGIPTVTPTPTAALTGNALKNPDQLAIETRAALLSLSTFRLHARFYVADGLIQEVDMKLQGTGRVTGTSIVGSKTINITVYDGTAFLEGANTTITVNGKQYPAKQWVAIPPGSVTDTGVQYGVNLSDCLFKEHGTLRIVGVATYAGQPTVQVEDRGDVPDSVPAVYHVALNGPPYPLYWKQTEKTSKGCGVKVFTPTGTIGDVTFSEFNQPVTVNPPPSFVTG